MVKQIALKSFIKTFKITYEVKTSFSNIAGSKTATLLKLFIFIRAAIFLEFYLNFYGLVKAA